MYHDEDMPMEASPETDRRLELLSQYIDLERARERIAVERESLSQKSAKIDEEFGRVLSLKPLESERGPR